MIDAPVMKTPATSGKGKKAAEVSLILLSFGLSEGEQRRDEEGSRS